jgi:hypothetical protein
LKIAICRGKDCRKHKKMQKKLQDSFPNAEEVECLNICKGSVVIVNGAILTKIRKKKHLQWLLESIEAGEWNSKLRKHLWKKQKGNQRLV